MKKSNPKQNQKPALKKDINYERITKYTPYVLIAFVILFNIMYISKQFSPWWDEAAYLGMAKYLFSSGTSGIWEPLRPVVLPFIAGIFWKLGLNIVLAGKIVMLLFSSAAILLVWLIARKIFSLRTAILSTILFALTPLFFSSVPRFLTDIPSMAFALASIYFFISYHDNKKYYLVLAGLFAGLAFLTRFAQILLIASYILYCVIMFLKKREKGVSHFKLSQLKSFIPLLFVFMSFAGTFILYLVFNYWYYGKSVIGVWQAMILPFNMYFYVATYYNWVYSMSYSQYFLALLKNNFMLLFAIPGIYSIAKIVFSKSGRQGKTGHEKVEMPDASMLLAIVLIAFFAFFELTPHKEERYLIALLPFISIIAAYGLERVMERAPQKKIMKRTIYVFISVLLLFVFVVMAMNINANNFRIMHDNDPLHDYYTHFQGIKADKPILTTTPLPTIYSDSLFIPFYYTLDYSIGYWNSKPLFSYVMYSESAFPCKAGDSVCEKKRAALTQAILGSTKVIEKSELYNVKYYVLERD